MFLRAQPCEELLRGEGELETGLGWPAAKAEKGRRCPHTGASPASAQASPAGAARRRLQVVLSPWSNRVWKGGVWPRELRSELSITYPPGKQQVNTHSRTGGRVSQDSPQASTPSPPGSMSESVRCVREKLAMLAGEMENREYGAVWGQLCSALRGGGGGEKYLEVCRDGLELRRLLVVFDIKGSGEKSSSHSKPPPTGHNETWLSCDRLMTKNRANTPVRPQVSKHRSANRWCARVL